MVNAHGKSYYASGESSTQADTAALHLNYILVQTILQLWITIYRPQKFALIL